jgi:predicted CXXCH cytochrome family protein
MYNVPNGDTATAINKITGDANLGIDLTDDHPVNFDYNQSLVDEDGGLKAPTALANVQLFAGKVQCATCHDAHDPDNGAFLVTTNNNSALCMECHNK